MRTKQIVSGTAALALSALLFTACNNENDPTPAISSKYVTIVPTVTGEVITKASSSYGQTGDPLYLTIRPEIQLPASMPISVTMEPSGI